MTNKYRHFQLQDPIFFISLIVRENFERVQFDIFKI